MALLLASHSRIARLAEACPDRTRAIPARCGNLLQGFSQADRTVPDYSTDTPTTEFPDPRLHDLATRAPSPATSDSAFAAWQAGDGAPPTSASGAAQPMHFRSFEHERSREYLGAKLGANDRRLQATPGHDQLTSVQLDGSLGYTRRHTAMLRRCLLSSGSRVRILPGAPTRVLNWENSSR